MSFKPQLKFSQIINMNVGFLGIQYSFGLQQSAVNPIYDMLGASPDQIPFVGELIRVKDEEKAKKVSHFIFHVIIGIMLLSAGITAVKAIQSKNIF